MKMIGMVIIVVMCDDIVIVIAIVIGIVIGIVIDDCGCHISIDRWIWFCTP